MLADSLGETLSRDVLRPVHLLNIATRRHPDMKVSLREKFRRVGAEEWDALRDRFKQPAAAE